MPKKPRAPTPRVEWLGRQPYEPVWTRMQAFTDSQIVLARLLGHEGYGHFAYVMAWINILVYVAVMGHDMLMMRNVAAHKARQEWALLAGVLRHAAGLVGGLSIAISALGAFLISRQPGIPAELGATFLAGFVVLPLLAMLRLNAAVLYGQGQVVLGTAPERLGRDAVVLLLAFLGGMIMLALGVIGVYIFRIFQEVLARPRYLIDETVNLEGTADGRS